MKGTITNKFNLPQPVVDALVHDDYSRGSSNRSVTQLIDSPRYRILCHEHANEITYDASELIWMALGKGVHKMFEDFAGGKWKAEERLFAECRDWTISGQVDVQEVDEEVEVGLIPVVLYDYKVTSVWSIIFGKESYAQQLNFYAWLARQNGMKVVGLKIVFVLRDWKLSEMQRKRKDEYPEAPIMVVDIPLWSEDKQTAYVVERVKLHQEAEFARITGAALPHCSDEERWKRESSWAVKKPANKTAKRVLSSYEKAVEYIQDNELDPKVWQIEERPEQARRCSMGYCPVADFCDQWQAEKPDE